MNNPETILEEAQRITSSDREREYGHPFINHERIAGFWSVVLETPVTAEQVALCLLCVKIAREMNGHKRDSVVDMAGYANVLQRIVDERERRTIVKTGLEWEKSWDKAATEPSMTVYGNAWVRDQWNSPPQQQERREAHAPYSPPYPYAPEWNEVPE